MERANHFLKSIWAGTAAGWLMLIAATWLAVTPGRVIAEAVPSKEYQVKAACLLNFAQFIQWPAAAFPDGSTPITIGVLGDDPFGAALEQTFHDEVVQGRKLAIKRSKQVEDLKSCHLLFVSKSEKGKLAEILGSLSDATVATIGEMDDFARSGGIINFYIDNNKVRFEINAEAGQRKGLKISSQLLKRAKIVNSDAGKRKE